MLVGNSDDRCFFHPKTGMLLKLTWSTMDVRQAHARTCLQTVSVCILREVETGIGVAALDRLAVGMVTGARLCMDQPELLRAVFGNEAPLIELQGDKPLGSACTRGCCSRRV